MGNIPFGASWCKQHLINCLAILMLLPGTITLLVRIMQNMFRTWLRDPSVHNIVYHLMIYLSFVLVTIKRLVTAIYIFILVCLQKFHVLSPYHDLNMSDAIRNLCHHFLRKF